MGTTKSKGMNAVEEAAVLLTLQEMEADKSYATISKYHSNTEKYPDNQISFSDTHIAYLKRFPSINPQQYIQNLRIITKQL